MAKQDDATLQELYAARWADVEPRTALHQIVPNDELRHLASRRVAASILVAHGTAPDKWGMSDRVDLLRLNVGPAEASFIFAGGLRLMLHEPTAARAGHAHLLLTLEPTSKGAYKSVPDSVYVTIPFDEGATDFDYYLARLRGAHAAHLAIAAAKGLNGMIRKGHHPGLVDAIGMAAMIALPQPSYVHVRAPATTSAIDETNAPMNRPGFGGGSHL